MRELYNKKCGSKGRIFYAHTYLLKGEKCIYRREKNAHTKG